MYMYIYSCAAEPNLNAKGEPPAAVRLARVNPRSSQAPTKVGVGREASLRAAVGASYTP